MNATSSRPLTTLLIGGLIVGVFDGTYAVVFSAFRGVSAARLFQSVASGFFGRQSYNMGATTVALGVVIHFFIATCVVLVYGAAAHNLAALCTHPFLFGGTYGLFVYLFMNLVVIPLSAITFRPKLPAIISGIIVHIVLIGIPAALFARKAER
ncbi:MAG TPA: hypothetical protein VLV78_07375 [Thermoanaerobaculia bacterium]|nr:hypothetical protein [Thermoanaerobaculia bacterium]